MLMSKKIRVDQSREQRFIPEMSLNTGVMVNEAGLSRKNSLASIEGSVK